MLTQDQIQKINDFVKDKPVEVVYLFGSQATNTARPDSDYDFGILFTDKLTSHGRFETKIDILGFLTSLLKTDAVDLVDLNSSPIRFKYEAIEPRKIIYEKNTRITKGFEYKILTQYFDEMYFLKQTTRDYLQYFAHDQIR